MKKPTAKQIKGLREVHNLASADIEGDEQYPATHPVHDGLEYLRYLAYGDLTG